MLKEREKKYFDSFTKGQYNIKKKVGEKESFGDKQMKDLLFFLLGVCVGGCVFERHRERKKLPTWHYYYHLSSQSSENMWPIL